MLIDARDLASGTTLEGDVCIAGAGAAGITMALSLSRAGISVLLLESGGLELETPSQALYEGEMAGIKTWSLDRMRKRQFGGTTNHWNGWCRPLSPEDFEERSYIPNSGWPIDYDSLEPFYERACELVQIGPFDFDTVERAAALGISLLPSVRDLETRYYQYSPPTRFGKIYRSALTEAANVKVVLHANLVDIRLASGNARVSSLSCKTLDGVAFHAEASRYVLALGGLESARVLLAAQSQAKAGVANGNDVVGRYFMEHPHYVSSAAFVQSTSFDYRFYDLRQGADLTSADGRSVELRGAFALTAEARAREGLLNFTTTFAPAPPETTDTGPFAPSTLRALVGRDGRGPALSLFTLRCEQSPRPDSRITLSEDRDALGMPRIVLDWRIAPEDDVQMMRAARRMAQELAAQGVGRVWLPREQDRFAWTQSPGGHHMGTTRMGKDPRTSVVDADSRCHEVHNLYITGGSVFTTGGDANPTLTVVALALRLAAHLMESP